MFVTQTPNASGGGVLPNPLPVIQVQGEGSFPLADLSYTTTPVTSAAYVTLLASTPAAIRELDIFDSSGQALVLAVGAPSSEVPILYIAPGGTYNRVPVGISGTPGIPAGSRLSLKAVSTSATVGNNITNGYA